MAILLKSKQFFSYQPIWRKQGFTVITSAVMILVISSQMRICSKSPFFVVFVLRDMSSFIFSRFDLKLEQFGIDIRGLQDIEMTRELLAGLRIERNNSSGKIAH